MSVFMLFVLGMTLGAEAFAGSQGPDPCGSSLSQFVPLAEQSDPGLYDVSWQPSHGEEACPDPCHAGYVHFGHCSFLALSSTPRWIFPELSQETGPSRKSSVDAPSLESLRRPPRPA